MGKKYTSEQFWQLYRNLTPELQDAIFSEENSEKTYEICKKNEVQDKLGDVVDCIGQVLVGVLPPMDFQKALENEAGITPEIAQKIAQEINKSIFYPAKSSLEALYSGHPSEEVKSTNETDVKQSEQILPEDDDNYREPLE